MRFVFFRFLPLAPADCWLSLWVVSSVLDRRCGVSPVFRAAGLPSPGVAAAAPPASRSFAPSPTLLLARWRRWGVFGSSGKDTLPRLGAFGFGSAMVAAALCEVRTTMQRFVACVCGYG